MTLAGAILAAQIEASGRGHTLTEFRHDTLLSAIADCADCGELAAVDVSHGGGDTSGRALLRECAARPTPSAPVEPQTFPAYLREHYPAIAAMVAPRTAWPA